MTVFFNKWCVICREGHRELYGHHGWNKRRIWGQDARQQRMCTQTAKSLGRILGVGETSNSCAVPHAHFLWGHHILPTHKCRYRACMTSSWEVLSDAPVLVCVSNCTQVHRKYKSGNTCFPRRGENCRIREKKT